MRIISGLIILVALGMSVSGCKAVINKLAFHPDNINVVPVNELPTGIHEITVETDDKLKINNLYLPLEESNKIVIYFHGNAGNIYHRIPSLIQLQNFGVNVFGASYRGYGKNEGKPSEAGIYLDGKAVIEYVHKVLGFSHENIIVIGRSIGTTVAVNTTQDIVIGGLILVTPLTSGKAHANAGSLSLLSSLAGNSFDNLSKIKNIKSPIMVIHGTNDRVIPYFMGKEVFDAAMSKKEFVTIGGAGHNNLQDDYAQQYWSAILSFLKMISS